MRISAERIHPHGGWGAPRVPRPLRRVGRWALVCAGLLFAASARAQSPADELAKAGEAAMAKGNYPEAIRNYEKLTTKYQSYEHTLEVKFDLAWAYYLTKAYTNALPLFEELSGPRAPSAEIREQSKYLTAESHAHVAGTLPLEDAARKKHLTEAIERHTKFQVDNMQSPMYVPSLYGRAYAYYLDAQYDKAEADLNVILKTYASHPIAKDAPYLLANVFSQQGLALRKAGKKEEAQTFIEKARALFERLAADNANANLALSNDSVFSLAETWFNAQQFTDAIRYFRQVRDKADVLQNLKFRQERLQEQLAREIGTQQDTTLTKRELDKTKSQISAVREAPELTISAYFRIAQCFFNMNRRDEARLVCRHLLDFTEGEQRQQAYMLVIKSLIQDKKRDEAAAEFETFQQMFGVEAPIAEEVSLGLGQLFLVQGDPTNALLYFKKSMEEYPEGRAAEDSLFMKFTAEYVLGQYTNTIANANLYTNKFPKGARLANALYYKAMAQAMQNDWSNALAGITDVMKRFPDPAEGLVGADEMAFQKGWILAQAGKADEAIAQLKAFLEKHKDSKLAPQARYQLAQAQNTKGQLDEAGATLRSIAKDFPHHELGTMSLLQIAVFYFQKEDVPNAKKAFQDVIQAFPSHPVASESYYFLGWIAKNKDNQPDAAVSNYLQCIAVMPANNAHAADCTLQIAGIYKEKTDKMGAVSVMTDDKKAAHRGLLLEAAKTHERLLVDYPLAPEVLDAIPGLAEAVYTLVKTKQMTEADAGAYFEAAKARYADRAAIRAQICYSFGIFRLRHQQKDQALALFKEALSVDPDVRVSYKMLLSYAEALKAAKAFDEAAHVYNKIIGDNPDDPNAQAPAWFGLADIKYLQDDPMGAEELFEKVLGDYPWFEEGKQGKVKLATLKERDRNYKDAMKMYTEVCKEKSAATRAAAMAGVARCALGLAEEGKAKSDPWQEMAQQAVAAAEKIDIAYQAFPEAVAEALWVKGVASEMLDNKTAAKESFYRYATDFKNHPHGQEAAERLQKLGGYTPPAPAKKQP